MIAMMVYGVNAADVQGVVARVSALGYSGNVVLKTVEDATGPRRGPAARFTLKVADSYGPGARGSASMSGRGPNGTRALPVACWHAHYDVLRALALFAHAHGRDFKVRGVYDYDAPVGHEGMFALENQMYQTQWVNIGSPMQPVTPIELCEC